MNFQLLNDQQEDEIKTFLSRWWRLPVMVAIGFFVIIVTGVLISHAVIDPGISAKKEEIENDCIVNSSLTIAHGEKIFNSQGCKEYTCADGHLFVKYDETIGADFSIEGKIGCIMALHINISRDDAEEKCKEKGSELLNLDSNLDIYELKNFVAKIGLKSVWLSAKRSSVPGTPYEQSFMPPLERNSQLWFAGEPNWEHFKIEWCVQASYHWNKNKKHLFGLDNVWCVMKFCQVICQMEPKKEEEN